MPAWLTPRVRLGATASLIVLIAAALEVTPHLFHDDAADAPGSLSSLNSSIDLHAVPPPPSRKPPIVLPHIVLSEIDSTPRPPSGPLSPPRGAADGGASYSTSSTQIGSPEPAQSAESDQTSQAGEGSQGDSAGPSYSLASDGSQGGGGGAPFAANGILVPPSAGSGGLRGGTPKQQQPIPLGYDSGGVPPPPPPVVVPSVVPPVVVQPVTLPPNGSGSGDNPGDPPPPIKPPDPPVVQVPEPASLAMAGLGALSFMIRARLARKRRG